MAKSLRDYADALVANDLRAYKLQVLTASGAQFSIHKDQESAERAAAQVSGTIEPFTPILSTYWNPDQGAHYDH